MLRFPAGAIAVLATLVLAACSSRGLSTPNEPVPPGPTAVPATPTPSPASVSVYAPGWSAVHADPTNSDYSPVRVADELAIRWRRHFDGAIKIGALEWTINLGPTISADGSRLYLTTTVRGCHLRAIDTATGETLWCSDRVDLEAVVSSPLIDREGRLYIADGRAMHAFEPDGAVAWATPIVGVPLSAQFTPAGNLVFITHVGIAYVLNRATGAPAMAPLELVPSATWDGVGGLWDCARGLEGCPSANTVAVDLDTGRVFFTFWEPGAPQAGLRAMRLVEDDRSTSLVPLWENISLPGGSASSPALSADGSRVYVTDNVDSVHALDAESGAIIWSFAFGAASGGSVSLSPDGVIMAAGGELQALRDEGDHAVRLWRWEGVANRGIATQAAGNRAFATVAAPFDETVPASRYTNDLVIVDTRTGKELGRVPIEGVTVFSVGITIGPDGTVYVPFIQGDLVALGPVTPSR